MKSKKVLYSAILAIAIIIVVAICFIFGRGHSIYLDNKTDEANGITAYEQIKIYKDDEKIATLAKKERGVTSNIGQTLTLTLEIKKTKASSTETITVDVPLPYSIDNIVINLPAFLEGKGEEVYLSEFVPLVTETEDDSAEEIEDEFNIGE